MRVGSHHSLETKKKQSESHSGKNNYWYGKRLSVEHKKKMSLATKRQMTPEFRKSMSDKRKGSKHPQWKGGRNLASKGYVRVFLPGHPRANQNYVLEHRIVMERHIGRYLKPEEVVHHINEVKTDNRLPNLWLYENSYEHLKGHRELNKAKTRFIEGKDSEPFKGIVALWTPEEVGICIDEMTGEVLYMPEEYR